MTANLYNVDNKLSGSVEIPDRVFKAKWNPDLVHMALRVQLANKRSPSAHTKGRGEVRGGGRKPWRQKGTGRARHGSIRSPLWVGGGVAHGPTKEKKYELKINKKMKQLAIFSVLAKRFALGEIKIIDNLHLEEPKTKLGKALLTKFQESSEKKFSFLLIPESGNKNIYQAVRNLEGVKAINPKSLNVYDLLRYKTILLDQAAIKTINEHYHEVK
jgi:large subunit ribosomal protein L4